MSQFAKKISHLHTDKGIDLLKSCWMCRYYMGSDKDYQGRCTLLLDKVTWHTTCDQWRTKNRGRQEKTLRACSVCKKAKRDVTGYHIESASEDHTFWSLDMCIDCRDNLFAWIKNEQAHYDEMGKR